MRYLIIAAYPDDEVLGLAERCSSFCVKVMMLRLQSCCITLKQEAESPKRSLRITFY